MLSFKNLLSKSSAPADPPKAVSVDAAEKAEERWRLQRGRTRKRVEELTSQLEAARDALAKSEQALGEKMADGVERTSDADAMNRAADHVRALEVALSVATAKDDAAQAELQQAERALASELEEIDRARGAALGPSGMAVLVALEQFAQDLASEAQSGRLAGWAATELRGQFQLFAGLAMHPVTQRGHVSPKMMKFPTWSDCIRAHFGEPDA